MRENPSGEPVVVVGAGVSGLCCGIHLARAGIPVRVLDGADAPGGRVRSDRVDGFRLDRGFQVLLTAYPEARRMLDIDALRLRHFVPGAQVWHGGRLARVADPFRRPQDAFATLASGVATPGDAWRVARLALRLRGAALEDLLAAPERPTLGALRELGFSSRIIERFFRPFFAGVFLEGGLDTSSRFLEFAFAMFARGDAAIPADGMGAISDQLASRLPAGALGLEHPVRAVEDGGVVLENGDRLAARAVVVACEAPAAGRLLPGIPVPEMYAVGCLHFAAPEPPVRGPWLVLDGEGSGPVNNLCVMSEVAPDHAPPGQALISASVLGPCKEDDATLEAAARAQLGRWFGSAVEAWRLLRVDRIPHALPSFAPGVADSVLRPATLAPGRFVCGDHRALPSLQGAMLSGRRAAQAVVDQTA